MLKIYQSIRAFRLVTEIEIDGKLRTIEFSGGARQPRRRNGIFSTTQIKLQKAIENSPGFNKSYKLVKQVGESDPEPKSNIKEINHVDDIPDISDELDSKDYATADEKADYSKITKAQDARNILFELDETLTYNDVKSKVLINEQAKRLNVSFPNLV